MQKERPASWSVLHMIMLKFVMVRRVVPSFWFVYLGVLVADYPEFR